MPEKPITSCRDCVFAQWDDSEQIGCDFDRLEKFEENGAEIVGCDDNTKKYFLVNGRFCNTCRDHNWGARHPEREWREIVEKDIATSITVLIYVDDSTTLEEIARSVQSAIDQTHQPTEIIVALHNPHLEERKYVNMMRFLDPEIPWLVKRVYPEQINTYTEKRAPYIALDLALQGTKSTYYCMIYANYELPLNFLKTIDNAINVEMMRFVAIRPDEYGNGLVAMSSLHKLIGGNNVKSVLEKIDEIASEESNQHMIKRYEDLPPCE